MKKPETCPECGAKMMLCERFKLWVCTRYPLCRFCLDENGKPVKERSVNLDSYLIF